MLPKQIEKDAVRYVVSKDVQGRPRVAIHAAETPSVVQMPELPVIAPKKTTFT
jgi:hypothetical protein